MVLKGVKSIVKKISVERKVLPDTMLRFTYSFVQTHHQVCNMALVHQ